MKEIQERLTRPRLSSHDLDKEFEEFRVAFYKARNEKQICEKVLPYVEGKDPDDIVRGADTLWNNFEALTDGALSLAKPDVFYGARPEQLHRDIRKRLSRLISPCTQEHISIVPNFVLEVKGRKGIPEVADLQMCYDGALCARSIRTLQLYTKKGQPHDGNAYTIASTFSGGTLQMYASHMTSSKDPKISAAYHLTLIMGWYMIGNPEGYLSAIDGYRNLREWAMEQRDKIIEAANETLADTSAVAQSSRQAAGTPTTAKAAALVFSDSSADELASVPSASKKVKKA